jgi:hypothetical protein
MSLCKAAARAVTECGWMDMGCIGRLDLILASVESIWLWH